MIWLVTESFCKRSIAAQNVLREFCGMEFYGGPGEMGLPSVGLSARFARLGSNAALRAAQFEITGRKNKKAP